MTFDHSSKDRLENFLKPSTPAALTSTRIGPSSSRIADIAVSTCARSVTSATWPTPSSVGDRSRTATRNPSLRNRSATARPIPEAPPVTTAVFALKPPLHFPERSLKRLASHAYHPVSPRSSRLLILGDRPI